MNVDIGEASIALNLNDRHENAYHGSVSGGKKILDHIIAETFITEGDVVVDVGANIGFCALMYLAHGASKVYSFEPHPQIFTRLETLAHEQLIVSNLALSDSVGECELMLSSAHNQGHTLSKSWAGVCTNVFGDSPEVCTVKTSTLDHEMRDIHIDFLKIDIEGVEVEFLNGARNILANDPPRMIHIEIYPQVLEPTVKILREYYTHVKRCVVTKDETIRLIDVHAALTDKDIDHNHPPTYICHN